MSNPETPAAESPTLAAIHAELDQFMPNISLYNQSWVALNYVSVGNQEWRVLIDPSSPDEPYSQVTFVRPARRHPQAYLVHEQAGRRSLLQSQEVLRSEHGIVRVPAESWHDLSSHEDEGQLLRLLHALNYRADHMDERYESPRQLGRFSLRRIIDLLS